MNFTFLFILITSLDDTTDDTIDDTIDNTTNDTIDDTTDNTIDDTIDDKGSDEDEKKKSNNSGIGIGGIVSIVLGIIFLSGIILFLFCFFKRKNKKNNSNKLIISQQINKNEQMELTSRGNNVSLKLDSKNENDSQISSPKHSFKQSDLLSINNINKNNNLNLNN